MGVVAMKSRAPATVRGRYKAWVLYPANAERLDQSGHAFSLYRIAESVLTLHEVENGVRGALDGSGRIEETANVGETLAETLPRGWVAQQMKGFAGDAIWREIVLD